MNSHFCLSFDIGMETNEPKWYVKYAYYNHECYNLSDRLSCMSLVNSHMTNSQIKTQRTYHITNRGEKIHVN